MLMLLAAGAPESGAQKKVKGKGKVVKAPAAVVIQPIHHFQELPPGAGAIFTVTCPPGWTLGSWRISPESDFAIRFVRVTSNLAGTAYTFSFANTAFPVRPVIVGVIVNCIKPAVPAPAAAMVGKGPRIIVRIGPRQQATGTATCPKGQIPAGDSVEQGAGTTPRQAQASTAGGVGAVQVTSALPSGRSMVFGLLNPGDLEETVTVGVNCLRKTFRARGKTWSIRARQSVFDVSVPPGDHLFNGSCSGGSILSTGFALPADGRISFLGGGQTPDGVSVKLGNHTVQAEPAQIALLCVRGKTRPVQES